MKLITRNTDYAVRALLYIAKQKGKVVPATELVSQLQIPKPFLRKILQILNKEGLLKSFKGQGGGFLLGKPAGKIILADIAGIFQGPLKFNECVLKKRVCPDIKTCPLKKELNVIEQYAISKLKSITLASLMGSS
jgi:Rrf2 family protein